MQGQGPQNETHGPESCRTHQVKQPWRTLRPVPVWLPPALAVALVKVHAHEVASVRGFAAKQFSDKDQQPAHSTTNFAQRRHVAQAKKRLISSSKLSRQIQRFPTLPVSLRTVCLSAALSPVLVTGWGQVIW
jgi:hypothetical protein